MGSFIAGRQRPITIFCPCGDTRVFKTKEQERLWCKLHEKKCEVCKSEKFAEVPLLQALPEVQKYKKVISRVG